MSWLWLTLAGLMEIGWAIALKASHGFTRPGPSLLTAAGLAASMALLALALRALPLGTAYAVWTGIGTVGTVVCGILFFDEPTDFRRLACLLMIVVGIVGLRLLSPR